MVMNGNNHTTYVAVCHKGRRLSGKVQFCRQANSRASFKGWADKLVLSMPIMASVVLSYKCHMRDSLVT